MLNNIPGESKNIFLWIVHAILQLNDYTEMNKSEKQGFLNNESKMMLRTSLPTL